MSVKIPVAVKSGENGSYIQADNLVAGAQSSYNDVILRMTLEDEWANTPSVIANFTDAHGEQASTVLFLDNMMPDPVGMPHTYDVPIPADAKVYEGDISVVVTGYEQEYDDGSATFSGDGTTKAFTLTDKPFFVTEVEVGGAAVSPSAWSYDNSTGVLTFTTAPASGTDNIEVTYPTEPATSAILRTANCFMRVLPAAFSVVTDDELDSSIVEQLLAELYYQRGQSAEARTARDGAVTAKNDAESARDDAESARDDAESARDDAITAKDDAESAKDDAVAAKNDAITAKNDAVAAKDDAVAAKNHALQSSTQAYNYKEQAISAKNTAVTAKDDAVSAKNAAVAAKDDAESAEANAESAKDDAVTAKNAAVAAKDDAVIAKEVAENAMLAAQDAKDDAESAADRAEAAMANKAEVIYPIVYNNSSEYPPDPTATDEGDYWYCPDEDKLYRAEGSPLAWVDYSEKLNSENLFVNGSVLCYYNEYAEPQVTPVSATPTSHTHNTSQITDFSSAVTSATAGKADKVVSAVSNNFASFNTVGNIKDSGKKASDFAAASHTHTLSQITGLPVPTIADAGKYIAVNDAGEYVLVSGPAPTPTYTITLQGTGSSDCCCWLASDPSTVYMDENGGYMGQVEIASDDKLVCYVDNIEMAAVVVNGDTQTLVDNKCEITPTGDMALTFNYSGGPSGESVIDIVM